MLRRNEAEARARQRLVQVDGIPAWRCDTATDFTKRVEEALASDGPSVIAVPIDYSPDASIVEELEDEPTAT